MFRFRLVRLELPGCVPGLGHGAVFFSGCLVGCSGFEANLSGAGLFNMVAGSATVSTALDVSGSVLECYYGTSQP